MKNLEKSLVTEVRVGSFEMGRRGGCSIMSLSAVFFLALGLIGPLGLFAEDSKDLVPAAGFIGEDPNLRFGRETTKTQGGVGNSVSFGGPSQVFLDPSQQDPLDEVPLEVSDGSLGHTPIVQRDDREKPKCTASEGGCFTPGGGSDGKVSEASKGDSSSPPATK